MLTKLHQQTRDRRRCEASPGCATLSARYSRNTAAAAGTSKYSPRTPLLHGAARCARVGTACVTHRCCSCAIGMPVTIVRLCAHGSRRAAAAAAAAAAGGASAAMAPRQAQQQRRRRPRPSGRDRARPGVARGSPRTPRAGHGACAVAVACASHSRIVCVVACGVGPRASSIRIAAKRAASVLTDHFCDTYVANALPAWSITTHAIAHHDIPETNARTAQLSRSRAQTSTRSWCAPSPSRQSRR